MFGIHLSKKVEDADYLDLWLLKLGTAFLMLFLLLAIPSFMEWLQKQNPWLMLGISIIFFAKPVYEHYLK